MASIAATLDGLTGAILPAGLLAAAAASDLRRRIIPNALPAALALSGAAASLWSGGPAGLAWAGAAAVAVLALGATLFVLDALGGGDVKLAAAAALWLGPAGTPAFLALTSLIGAALAAAVAAGRFGSRVRAGRGSAAAARAALAAPVPYGVAIALAATAVLIWGDQP